MPLTCCGSFLYIYIFRKFTVHTYNFVYFDGILQLCIVITDAPTPQKFWGKFVILSYQKALLKSRSPKLQTERGKGSYLLIEVASWISEGSVIMLLLCFSAYLYLVAVLWTNAICIGRVEFASKSSLNFLNVSSVFIPRLLWFDEYWWFLKNGHLRNAEAVLSRENFIFLCFLWVFFPSVPPYNGGGIWKRPMPSGRKLGALYYTDNNSISFCGHAKIKRYECLNSIDFSFSYLECFAYS